MGTKNEKIQHVKCLTHPFRVSYPKVFKPDSNFDGGEPKYSLTMLFPKKTNNGKPADGQANSLEQIIERAAIEKFGKKKDWPKKLKMPLKDGDEETNYPEYKVMMYATISAKKKPVLIDLLNNNEEIIDPTDFYAGCWARAVVIAGGFDNKAKGVTLTVMSIQKLEDDKPFSGGATVESAVNEFSSAKFKPIETELDDEDEEIDDEDDEETDEDDEELDDEDSEDEDDDEDEAPFIAPKKKKKAAEPEPVKKKKKKK